MASQKLYDHPAVSQACFSPRPGPTLPVTGSGRPVELRLDDGSEVGGYLVVHLSGAPVLLLLHEVDEILADHLERWTDWTHRAGANLFLLDWPGYASSGGSPSFSACREASAKALDYLLQQDEAEVPEVVILGRGVGAVFAIDLFKEGTPPRVNGLVLESGLTDVADWVAERVPWDKTQFKPEDVMAELDAELAREFTLEATLGGLAVPVLVLHSQMDTIAPPQNGELLAEWAGSQRMVLFENGDHSTVEALNAPLYVEELKRYLSEVAPRREV